MTASGNGGDGYTWQDGALLLHVRVQPRASRDEYCGIQGESLKIRLTAPPVDGKANAGLIAFLAKWFKVPKSGIRILSGETSREKRVCIQNPARLPDFIRPPSGMDGKPGA